MKWSFLTLACVCLLFAETTLLGQATPTIVLVAVIGESNLKTNFIEDLKEAATKAKLQIDVAPRTDPNLKYTLLIAQESTIDSAAAAVIVLDQSGDVAMSVVRSGRLSGRGALNACAKELVKKIAVLAR